jgi:hypothetical protein
MATWLFSGSPERWKIAFEESIWGISEGSKGWWDRVQPGDAVVFYATRIAGILGYGTITEKYIGDDPLWPLEKREDAVLWPYRFKLKVEKIFDKPKRRPSGVFAAFAINKLSEKKFKEIINL